MLAQFATVILYGQLLLADPVETVGLLWSGEEVAQGFAWDRAEVAFGIPDHDGTCLVNLDAGPPVSVADDALWAVAVPFTATGSVLEAGTVLLEHRVAVPPGRYQVVFQARPGAPDHAYRLDIRLTPSDAPVFAILRRGGLGTDTVLRRQADRVAPP